jgi:hypothetical protein
MAILKKYWWYIFLAINVRFSEHSDLTIHSVFYDKFIGIASKCLASTIKTSIFFLG